MMAGAAGVPAVTGNSAKSLLGRGRGRDKSKDEIQGCRERVFAWMRQLMLSRSIFRLPQMGYCQCSSCHHVLEPRDSELNPTAASPVCYALYNTAASRPRD